MIRDVELGGLCARALSAGVEAVVRGGSCGMYIWDPKREAGQGAGRCSGTFGEVGDRRWRRKDGKVGLLREDQVEGRRKGREVRNSKAKGGGA